MAVVWSDEKIPRYLQVYQYYKDLIVAGKLPPGTKMPSVRLCAAQLQVSRTTAESAYMYLAADGYIISRPQSGFYVTGRGRNEQKNQDRQTDGKKGRREILYPFASSALDQESFDFGLWRRYVKSALRQDERLLSYGEPQGEYELREAICRYLSENRSAVCKPEDVIVGAGVQSLLHILCPLLGNRKKVFVRNPRFRQGSAVFQDHGFERCDSPEAADVLYITPSQMTRWGDVMPVAERMELIRTSEQRGQLIIEDDYDSEFRYMNRPTPCLQGLAGGEQVVYISTFSKLLLPSIRISFMILPSSLREAYQIRRDLYNQTASKTEQIALCQFIRDGHLGSQIRKAKRLYTGKARQLSETIEDVFSGEAKAVMGQAGFYIQMEFASPFSLEELAVRAEESGISLVPMEADGTVKKFLLSCSCVPADSYRTALLLLKEAWKS